MHKSSIEIVIEHIYANMSGMADEMEKLSLELTVALSMSKTCDSPEIRKVFLGYMQAMDLYANLLVSVCKMLEAICDGNDEECIQKQVEVHH